MTDILTPQRALDQATQELDILTNKRFSCEDRQRNWNVRYVNDKGWAIDYLVNNAAEKTARELVYRQDKGMNILQNHVNADLMAASAIGLGGQYAIALRAWHDTFTDEKKELESKVEV